MASQSEIRRRIKQLGAGSGPTSPAQQRAKAGIISNLQSQLAGGGGAVTKTTPQKERDETPLPEVVGGEPIEEQQIDVTQPSPGGVQVGQFADRAGRTITDPRTGKQFTADEQGIFDASRFQEGFRAQPDTSLVPQTAVEGRRIVSDAVGPAPQEAALAPQSPLDTFIQTNPLLGGLIQQMQDFMSPENQRASLVEEYTALSQRLGIEALETERLSLKNVIEGTEDDIRLEVTKASGFATDSQVLALTNARNKVNIKNYNNLVDTINSKERMLNTLIGLEAQDRQAADARFNTMFNMTAQIATFQQQFIRDTRSTLQSTASQFGWDAVFQNALNSGDSNAVARINQAMGGGFDLEAIAALPDIDRKIKELQVQKLTKEIANIGANGGIVGLVPGATITPEQLSPLAKAVYDGTIGLNDVTPTQRAAMAPELNAVGYTKAVTGEMKRDVEFIQSGVDNVFSLWQKVPGKYKGFLQGFLGERLGTKQSPEVAAFKAEVGIIGMTLTRMFEKGRISDQDRLFYLSLLPNLRMNEETASAGAQQVKQVLGDRVGQSIIDLGESNPAPDGSGDTIIFTD